MSDKRSQNAGKTEMSLKIRQDGFFWYSEKQKEVYHLFGHTHKNFCNIGGKIKEYTECKSHGHLRDCSNYEDAVCLGYGFYTHSEC